MRKVLEFLIEHEKHLRPIELHMVNQVLKKLDMDRKLTNYEINEFCQMKTIIDIKLDPDFFYLNFFNSENRNV